MDHSLIYINFCFLVISLLPHILFIVPTAFEAIPTILLCVLVIAACHLVAFDLIDTRLPLDCDGYWCVFSHLNHRFSLC